MKPYHCIIEKDMKHQVPHRLEIIHISKQKL